MAIVPHSTPPTAIAKTAWKIHFPRAWLAKEVASNGRTDTVLDQSRYGAETEIRARFNRRVEKRGNIRSARLAEF